jgi:hypothetical protein
MAAIAINQLYKKMTEDELLDHFLDVGWYIDYNNPNSNELKSLLNKGLIVCCDSIPHGPMLNPSYTYVRNDNKGLKLALLPLATRNLFLR